MAKSKEEFNKNILTFWASPRADESEFYGIANFIMLFSLWTTWTWMGRCWELEENGILATTGQIWPKHGTVWSSFLLTFCIAGIGYPLILARGLVQSLHHRQRGANTAVVRNITGVFSASFMTWYNCHCRPKRYFAVKERSRREPNSKSSTLKHQNLQFITWDAHLCLL